MDKIIEWGRVAGTHGVRGEMKVTPWVDFLPLARQVEFFEINGKSYKKIAVRGHKNMVLLTLEGVDTMDRAQALRGAVITTSRAAIDLGEGHYFYSDLYGFEVYDTRLQRVIGVLDRIESYPGGDVYCVRGQTKEILIPIVPAFDKGADLAQRRVTVTTIEGMTEDED
ncbi:MAG: ribosome maturation factor RimM [Clostridia bacterium]|nr:ribosome maturation factor RimM [Clostridia bacterium]